MRRRVVIVAVLLSLLVGVPPVRAQDDLEADLDAIATQIDQITTAIETARVEQSEVVTQIIGTQSEIERLRADLNAAQGRLDQTTVTISLREGDLARVRGQLQDLYARIAGTRRDIADTRQDALETAVQAYMNAGEGLAVLAFTVAGFNDMELTLDYQDRIADVTAAGLSRLETLERQEERQQTLIEAEERLLAETVTQLRELRNRQQLERDQVATKTAAVERQLTIQRGNLRSLEEQVDEFENELAVLEREQEEIKALIEERARRDGSAPGILTRPVPGAITSGFGYRVHPIYRTRKLHTGVDMNARFGTSIVAASAGEVIYSGWRGGYGNTIILDHGGGMITLYAHQSSLLVSFGDVVEAGETIGNVGSTGLSTGPHLHFEVRLGGDPVDPAPYL